MMLTTMTTDSDVHSCRLAVKKGTLHMLANHRSRLLFAVLCLIAGAIDAAEPEKPQDKAARVIRFAAGSWDKGEWTAVRMANQAHVYTFAQLDGAIGTTMQVFNRSDYKAETDNAILLYDLGSTDAEFAVRFDIGQGFGGYACPGLCISPQVKNGMVESSIAVFVGDYTMAVWYQTTDTDGKTVRYKHLVQLGRWSDPTKPHTLRCRISKKESSVAIKLDDSDVVVLSFVGNKMYGSVGHDVNSLIGLWGCHGECSFREMTIFPQTTLPFSVPTAKKPSK